MDVPPRRSCPYSPSHARTSETYAFETCCQYDGEATYYWTKPYQAGVGEDDYARCVPNGGGSTWYAISTEYMCIPSRNLIRAGRRVKARRRKLTPCIFFVFEYSFSALAATRYSSYDPILN